MLHFLHPSARKQAERQVSPGLFSAQFWRRRLHQSWIIACGCLGFLVGIAVAFATKCTAYVTVPLLVVGILFLIFCLLKRRTWVLVLVVSGGACIGMWRASLVYASEDHYNMYINQNIQLVGTVTDDPKINSSQQGLRLGNIHIRGKPLGGLVWASVLYSKVLKRDDVVVLSGKLHSGFGNFVASMNFGRVLQTARPPNADLSRQLRDAFTAGIARAVPQPQAVLGTGYLLGQHNNLPPQLDEQLRRVGLIHLVIAGGYNVTILVRHVRRMFSKVSKYAALIGAVAVLMSLTLVAGFVAPMARTAIITGLSLTAWYYGRKIHPFVLLAVAAAITAAVEPDFVWGDVGWYLTFVAYAGLILVAPMLHEYFWAHKKPGMVRQICIDTIAVQIATTPLMAYAFGQYSVYGLPANVLVLPLMPLTMLLTALAGLVGMLIPSLATIAGAPAHAALSYTSAITNWFANAPGAQFGTGLSVLLLGVAYTLIVVLACWLWRKTRYDFWQQNMVE